MAVKCICKQDLTRSDRIGAVHDNNIVGLLCFTHENRAILDDQFQTCIIKGSLGQGGQVFFGKFNNACINFHHGHVVYGCMTQNLARHAAVTAADNQHAFGRAMGQNWHMC